MPSGVRVGDFRFREECIVVSRSGESASGGRRVPNMSILSRAVAEVVEYVRIHTLDPSYLLSQLLADTKDRRCVSHTGFSKCVSRFYPTRWSCLDRGAIVNRDPRDIRSLSPFLFPCCIVLPCPEFRSGPSAPSITKRFDLVCVRDRKVSVLHSKNASYTIRKRYLRKVIRFDLWQFMWVARA